VRLNATARWERTGRSRGPERPGAVFGPETFVEHIGDDALAPLAAAGEFAYVDPDEPAAHGWMVAVRAGGPGSTTRVRRIAVGSARSVLCAADPAGPASR